MIVVQLEHSYEFCLRYEDHKENIDLFVMYSNETRSWGGYTSGGTFINILPRFTVTFISID